MPNHRLHDQFIATVRAIRCLIDRINAEGREPDTSDVQQYAELVSKAEELRRACLPVPELDLTQAG